MGSNFKSKVLGEQIANIMRQWHAEVRERRKKQEQFMQSTRTSLSTEWSPRRSSASAHGVSSVQIARYTRSNSINKGKKVELEEEISNQAVVLKEETAEGSSSRRPSRARY